MPDKLAPDIQKRTNLAIKSASFGDGYEQRAASGLNSQRDVWDIRWIPLDSANANAVTAALDAVGGVDYLTWTPYGESEQKRFVVMPESRQVSWVAGLYRISCQIRQVF